MQVEDYIQPIDGRYVVQIGLSDRKPLTAAECEAIVRFGEPIINIGGSFTDGESLTYTLPTRDVRFPSQFPVKHIFDLEDFEDASARAVVFRDTIKARMVTARDTVLNTAAGAVQENITTA